MFKLHALRISLLFSFAALWEGLPKLGIVSRFAIPPLSEVIAALPDILNNNPELMRGYGDIYAHLYVTLYSIATAFAINAVLGVPLGFIIGYRRTVSEVYEPLLYLFYSIPSVVLYPLIFLIFGVKVASKIAFAVLLGIFPLIVSVIAGVRQVKHEYIRLARSLGVRGAKLLFKVIIPASAPSIMSGLRLCLSYTVIGVLFGEVVASDAGLGWIVATSAFNLDMEILYSIVLMVLILAYGMIEGMRRVERRLFPYAATGQ